MQRLLWCVLVGVGVFGACADDDPERVAPETILDEGPAALTNQTRVRLEFHATTDANTFFCQLDAAPLVECAPPFEAEVTDGPHTFYVAAALNTAVDASPAMHAWTVDATAPETTIVSGPPALDNSLTPVFELAGEDAGGRAVTFECALDGDPFTACTSPANLVVVDGVHVYQVRAKDAAGNVDATPAEHAWTLDATAPETLVTAGPLANATTAGAVQFAFRSPDASATFECQLDASAFAPCTSPHTFTNLADGSHTFAVRARDASAVDPSPASRTWIVDATPPDVTLTATPANPSNAATPAFGFAAADATATFECQLDHDVAFTACTSPWDAPALAEGTRTFRVRATDAVGNVSAVVAHTWLVDLTPPTVSISDAPPPLWPVDYYDFAFAASEPATFTCQLGSGAEVACASADGRVGDFAYATASTYTVRARDQAGNVGTAAVSWRSEAGLVLHYPWEQGDTSNTSLLAQRPSYSADGTLATQPAVGGWAGSALGRTVATNTYRTTRDALTSSTTGYVASLWVRATDGGSGTVVSTAGIAGGGFQLRLDSGSVVTLAVFAGGEQAATTGAIQPNRWTQLAVRTNGAALELWIDGVLVDRAAAAGAGFDATQALDVTVGGVTAVDLDDLRFYNRTFTAAEMCTVVARGRTAPDDGCVPLAPGAELDAEDGQLVNTGTAAMGLAPASAVTFVDGKLGRAVRIDGEPASPFALTNLHAYAAAITTARTLTFSFDASAGTGRLVDTRSECAGGECGLRVTFTGTTLDFVASVPGQTASASIPIASSGPTTVALVEQRTGGNTDELRCYVSGALVATLALGGTADVFLAGADALTLADAIGVVIDEVELWPFDLSASPELLCEHGFDGRWDPADRVCALTAN